MVHDLGPRPDDPVEAALWGFASSANWSLLHPEDERRFQEFIRLAATAQSELRATDVENRLLKYGMSKEMARKLGQQFGAINMEIERLKAKLDKAV